MNLLTGVLHFHFRGGVITEPKFWGAKEESRSRGKEEETKRLFINYLKFYPSTCLLWYCVCVTPSVSKIMNSWQKLWRDWPMHLQRIIAEGEKLGQVDISGPQGNLGSPPNQPTPLRISAVSWTVPLPVLLPKGPSSPHSSCERFPENFCVAPVGVVCFWETLLPGNKSTRQLSVWCERAISR